MRRPLVTGILVSLLLAVLTLTFLYPLYFMLINSLKTRAEYFTNPFSLPAGAAVRQLPRR